MEFILEGYPALQQLINEVYKFDESQSWLIWCWVWENINRHGAMGNYVAGHYPFAIALRILLNWADQYY